MRMESEKKDEQQKTGKGNSIREKISSINRNTLGIIICAAVLVLTLVVYLIARGGTSFGEKNSASNEKKEDKIVEEVKEIGDSNTDNISTDAKNDKKPWSVMNDDTYNVEISTLPNGYSGEFIEDGTDEAVKDVLSLQFKNNGAEDIQYAEYAFQYGNDVVSFKLSDLPAGQTCIVLESGRHEFKKRETLSLISRVVAQVAEIPFARDELLVVDNSDNTITIMNLTEKEIPIARVFYKNYDSESNVFFGGITYTAMAEKIPASSGVTVQPEHFKSGDCVVVGTGVYGEE